MSTRICVYKDCNNFYYRQDNSVCSDVTLFAFPKDTKRAKQWRLLGQVHPKIESKQLFMCSKHFDAKYLSRNKNRRILLGEATPFSYEYSKINRSLTTEDDNQKEMTPTSTTAQQSYYINPMEDDNPKNDVTVNCSSQSAPQSFYINLDDENLSIDRVVMVESTTTQSQENTKSDLLDKIKVSIVPASCKRARSLTPDDDQETPPTDDDRLIDPTEVSIFKFKGEQYVQMSREYYLHEKRHMLKQLRCYKRILKNIKMELIPFKDI